MKRLLGVVLVLVVACIPMNIQAQEVDLSFDYSGQKIEIKNAEMYFTQSWEKLDQAPTDCGAYIAWISDEKLIHFEINPKKVFVKVTYNKDWRESDPEEEKYTIVEISTKVNIITPGLNRVLGNPYIVKVERKIPNVEDKQ